MSESDVSAYFDANVVVSAFVADPDRMSLELPDTLKPEQRKMVKHVAEGHPELTCESFGFGSDRQLHIFKPPPGRDDTNNCTDNGVNGVDVGVDDPDSNSSHRRRRKRGRGLVIKNTFLHDATDPVMFRSMPTSLQLGLISASAVGESQEPQRQLPEEFVQTGDWIWPVFNPPPGLQAFSVALADKDAEVSHDGGIAALWHSLYDQSGVFPAPQLPPSSYPWMNILDQNIAEFQITADFGLVQLLPPATSTQFAEPRLEQIAGAESLPVTRRLEQVEVTQRLEQGLEVIIEGLVSRPDFNGHRGVIQSFDTEMGRYNVLLKGQQAKVKSENLRVALPLESLV